MKLLVCAGLLLVIVPPSATAAEAHGYLGMGFTYHPKIVGGKVVDGWLQVCGVAPDGPAARAGLRARQVITAFGGKPLRFRNTLEFLQRVDQLKTGERLELQVTDTSGTRAVVVEIGAMNADQVTAWHRNLQLAAHDAATAAR